MYEEWMLYGSRFGFSLHKVALARRERIGVDRLGIP